MLAVAKNLYFDVARPHHKPFDIDALHAKRRSGFGNAAGIGLGQGVSIQHRTHSTAAPTADRLDHHARTVFLRREERLSLRQSYGALAARH